MPKLSELEIKEIKNIKYLIVLGCRLFGVTPSRCLYERLSAALKLVKVNRDMILVCSGGQGDNEDTTEARAMKDFFVSNGVEESRIILEPDSHSTYENFEFSKEKILKTGGSIENNSAFVTNSFHVFRSKKIAELIGYKNIVEISAYTPKASKISNYLREGLSIINYYLNLRRKIKKMQKNSRDYGNNIKY